MSVLYHGSTVRLAPGERLTPATTPAASPYGLARSQVFLTTSPEQASCWALDACEMTGEQIGYVYAAAAPEAVHLPDPDDRDQHGAPAATVVRTVAQLDWGRERG